MAGGIGASKFSHSGLNTGHSDLDHMPALTIGLSYYSPLTIYQISGELCGLDSSGSTPSLGTLSPLGIRHFPFGRNSAGWSIYGAAEFTEFEAHTKYANIDRNNFGFEIGIGYDTDFDRFTYSYHTAQGGYHELELLVGLVAIQQGKAGLKASLLKGEVIRFATVQVYLENRILFETMELHRPRSLLTQALIYAGMLTAWFLVY